MRKDTIVRYILVHIACNRKRKYCKIVHKCDSYRYSLIAPKFPTKNDCYYTALAFWTRSWSPNAASLLVVVVVVFVVVRGRHS